MHSRRQQGEAFASLAVTIICGGLVAAVSAVELTRHTDRMKALTTLVRSKANCPQQVMGRRTFDRLSPARCLPHLAPLPRRTCTVHHFLAAWCWLLHVRLFVLDHGLWLVCICVCLCLWTGAHHPSSHGTLLGYLSRPLVCVPSFPAFICNNPSEGHSTVGPLGSRRCWLVAPVPFPHTVTYTCFIRRPCCAKPLSPVCPLALHLRGTPTLSWWLFTT